MFLDLNESLASTSCDEVMFVAKRKLTMLKKNQAARLVSEMNKSPGRAAKIMDAYGKQQSMMIMPYNADEALALVINMKLTRSSYNSLRTSLNTRISTKDGK